jgi:RecA/RadA recombinase
LDASKLNKLIKDIGATILSESIVFDETNVVPTPVPMINVLLSGRVDGGIYPGVTMIAGPSKHFKTGFSLLLMKAYLDQHEDARAIMFDSEFGAKPTYFSTFGIDPDRVLHIPVTEVEELTHKSLIALDSIEKGDHFFFFVDSIGNLASRKEVKDAREGNDKADMTRAKAIKAFFRITTAKCVLKGIPMVAVNHTYKEQSMFPKDVVSGGTGGMYNSNDVWIVGRKQDKEDKSLAGFTYVINVDKSRFVQEKSKVEITVGFKTGIMKNSGLLDLAIEGKYIKQYRSKTMMYQLEGEEQSYTYDEIVDRDNFWDHVFTTTDFKDYIKNKYALAGSPILGEHDANEQSNDDAD